MKILGFNFLLGIFENDMANFTAQDHVITHLKVSVNKKTKPGQYYCFIIGNYQTLREGKLIIE
ncbi:MAG: hypothetical protein E6K91_00765 [Thaumarchaeota archaeon]|nr:MAG: hypothetical protein E6K91_00765 [Nitrososphaerota archaeon]